MLRRLHQAAVESVRRRPSLHRLRLGVRYSDLRACAYVGLHRIPYRSLHPNLFIIGAQKSGTTSLHYYLDQHPDIFMTHLKETNLFLDDTDEVGEYHRLEPRFYGSSNREKRHGLSDDQIRRRMLQGYRGEPIIGDTSPYYTAAPVAGLEVPTRVKAVSPDARIVYILRNPLDRIVSNYHHDRVIHALSGEPINEDLSSRVGGRQHFLSLSLYHYQLSNYLKHFAPDRIRIIIFEEFARDPQTALEEITEMLGLARNVAFDTSMLYRASPVGQPRQSPAPVEAKLRFTSTAYERLIGPIRDDVAKLEAFLGRRLDVWDLSRKRWCIRVSEVRPRLRAA